ncbi:hypothetical protein [Nocardia sp. NPDC050406]|uniref:hypothetical protein n=1 Tax=Nocardia sp. NPDC050406 TaxID=3364318 RepID=UPI0037A58B7B
MAGLALMMPVNFGWAVKGSSLQLELLVFNVPRAITAGAVVAVVVAVLAVTLVNEMVAWATAFVALLVLAINNVLAQTATSITSLPTLTYVDAVFGGVLLGAVGAAVLGHRVPGRAFVTGALAGILVGDLSASPSAADTMTQLSPLERVIGWPLTVSPPLWLIVTAAALISLCAGLRRPWRAVPGPALEVPVRPLISMMLLAGVTLPTAEWLAERGRDTPAAIVAVLITVLVTAVAALLLPGRDGQIVALAVAFAAAGCAVIAVPRPDWSIPLLVVGVMVAAWAGGKRPMPVLAATLTVALAGYAVFSASRPGESSAIAVTGGLAIACVGGYCFGSTVPQYLPNRVYGLAVLFVPSVVLGLRGRDFARVGYSQDWYRSASGPHDPVAGWAAVAITLGCALVVAALARLRRGGPAETSASQ